MSDDILEIFTTRYFFFFSFLNYTYHPTEIILFFLFLLGSFSFLISVPSVISANCFRIVFVLYFFFLSFFFARVKEKRKVKKKNGRTGGGEKGGKIRKPYKPVTRLSGIYLSSPLLSPPVFLLSVIH